MQKHTWVAKLLRFRASGAPVAAEKLQGIVGNAEARVGGKALGHGRVHGRRRGLGIQCPSCVPAPIVYSPSPPEVRSQEAEERTAEFKEDCQVQGGS